MTWPLFGVGAEGGLGKNLKEPAVCALQGHGWHQSSRSIRHSDRKTRRRKSNQRFVLTRTCGPGESRPAGAAEGTPGTRGEKILTLRHALFWMKQPNQLILKWGSEGPALKVELGVLLVSLPPSQSWTISEAGRL